MIRPAGSSGLPAAAEPGRDQRARALIEQNRATITRELSSNVVDGGASGGVLDVGFAVDEARAADHVAEAGGTVEAAPATLSALAEPEDHG